MPPSLANTRLAKPQPEEIRFFKVEHEDENNFIYIFATQVLELQYQVISQFHVVLQKNSAFFVKKKIENCGLDFRLHQKSGAEIQIIPAEQKNPDCLLKKPSKLISTSLLVYENAAAVAVNEIIALIGSSDKKPVSEAHPEQLKCASEAGGLGMCREITSFYDTQFEDFEIREYQSTVFYFKNKKMPSPYILKDSSVSLSPDFEVESVDYILCTSMKSPVFFTVSWQEPTTESADILSKSTPDILIKYSLSGSEIKRLESTPKTGKSTIGNDCANVAENGGIGSHCKSEYPTKKPPATVFDVTVGFGNQLMMSRDRETKSYAIFKALPEINTAFIIHYKNELDSKIKFGISSGPQNHCSSRGKSVDIFHHTIQGPVVGFHGRQAGDTLGSRNSDMVHLPMSIYVLYIVGAVIFLMFVSFLFHCWSKSSYKSSKDVDFVKGLA